MTNDISAPSANPQARAPPPRAKATASRARKSAISSSDDEAFDNPNSPPAAAPPAKDNDTADLDDDAIPRLPPALLTRLMHESFRDKQLKIGKEANEVFRRYVDVFVREAVARAAAEKRERDEAAGLIDAGEEVWLDVEDLERVVPGLVLDF